MTSQYQVEQRACTLALRWRAGRNPIGRNYGNYKNTDIDFGLVQRSDIWSEFVFVFCF